MNLLLTKASTGLAPGTPETAAFFGGLEIGAKTWLKVIDKTKARTLSQNALYWKWLGEIVKQSPHWDDEDELHEEMKQRYVLPILLRDDEEYGPFIDKVQGLGVEAWKEFVKRHISTTDLNTKQFSEMLDKVHRDASQRGMRLTDPEELKW